MTERDSWQFLKLRAEIRSDPKKLMKNKIKKVGHSGDCLSFGMYVWWYKGATLNTKTIGIPLLVVS